MDVGLAMGFDEVHDEPTQYRGHLVIRLDQDDSLPDILRLTATPEAADLKCEGSQAYLRFAATVAQTTGLPPYDLVYFVELANLNATEVTRLFQGKVDIHD